MKHISTFFFFVLFINALSSQTTIYNNSSGFSIVAVTGPDPIYEQNLGPISIANCTSIQLSYNFAWTMDWEGGGNMESPGECAFSNPCAGDPTNPQAGDCQNCWDFLYGQVIVDGTEIATNLQGEWGETDQTGTVSLGPFCLDGESTLDLEFDCAVYGTNPDEGITVSNIMVLCWEGIPTINSNSPICGNDQLDLNGSALDESIINSWSWSNNGAGNINNSSAQNTFATGAEDGETYILEVTDENNCTATDEIIVSIEGPTANNIVIQGCESEFVSFDLNPFENSINATENVTWYSGQPSMGGVLLDPDDDVNILMNTNLWALVTDANGCTNEILIGLTITGTADPIQVGPIEACDEGSGAAVFDLSSYDGAITNNNGSTVSWYTDADLMNQIGNPSSFSSGTTSVYVTTFNGVCESFSLEIELEVVDSPTSTFTGGESLCTNECTTLITQTTGGSGTYEFTFNIFIPGTGNVGFVLPSYTGDPDIDVCLGTGGLVLDPIGNNVTLPAGINGTVIFTLVSIVDLNSPFCESIIIPPTEINIPIEEVDTPNDAGPLEGCNLGNGTADFDLTTLNNLINGGNGTMVNWYENIDLTGQIGIPSNYNSSSDFVYATLIDGACESDPVEIELIVLDELTYFLSGDLTLCPGQCEDVTFILEGGSGSYNLDVTITFLGIPINIPMGGVMSGVKITFCYGGSGFLPSYDAGSMTLTIPSSIQLSGSLSIDDMSDFNDPFCDGVSGGQSTAVIDLMEGPEAGDPDGLILCDEGGGFATFDLSPTESQILNGNTGSVIYYSDATLTNEISSPYYTSSTTIYAVIDDNGCLSDPVELELSVINNGDVGLVYLSCEENQPTTLCTICDTDGVAGELFTIFFNTQNPGLYNLIVEYVIDGTPTIATYNDFNAPGELDEFNITQVSTFTLISVEQIGVGCPDDTDLGDPVVITYGLQPDLDPLGPLNDCESVTLPIITGSNYSVAPLYYTQPLGGGTIYNAGDVISSSTVLYIFSGTTDCYDEETVIINIGGTTTYDQPGNIVQCGSYTLPPITGENVGNNTLYFTDPDGAGVSYEPGDEINLSNTNGTITLFIFDFVSTCATNQPFFSITITEAPEFTNENFVNGCSSFTLPMITGSNLSGSEYYSDQTGGLGNIINPGEIVSVNDTIYLYDESNGCITIDSVIINIEYPLNVGIDAIVTYCEGYDSPIDLMDLLGGTPAVGGIWDDESGTGISLVDSTSVNISSLAVGLYDFSYSGVSMICNNNSSSVFIEILPDVTAGLDSISNFCSSTMSVFDLNTFLIENTSQGIFINSNGDTILTPENLDLSNQMGLFEYYYITTDPNQCSQDTALVSISLQESNDAGEDVSTAICVGSQVDLSEILENNNATGLFEDNDATGGLIGNIFNSTGLAEDTYQFNHILPASNSCLADTSIINVVVSATVSAGITDSLQICFGDNVNLLTGLIGEDNGGVFFVENMVGVVPSIFNSTNTGIGEYNFIYVVGDNVTCPQDTSIVYVNVNELPELDFSITKNTICEGDSSFISLLNIANRNTFFDINVFKDNSLILTSIGYSDGLIPGFDIIVDEQNTVSIGNKKLLLDEFDVNYSIQFTNIENGSCFLDTIIEFDFTPISSITFDFNSSICSGQSIMVGNDVYDENNLSGTSMLQSVNGCDSIVNVNLQLSDQVYGPDYIRTTCDDNQVFVVFGETFDINNSYGEIVLQGASQAGCDSIIVVEIFYESDKQGPDYNEFTCDENYEITIGNEVFNVSNPSGIAILSGMASNGCDSSFIVNIDFLNDISGSFNFTTCDPTYNIEIGGIIFDVNNSLGTALLPGQASNGCDSIVDVELSFRNEVNENIFVTTCNEGFSLTIEGETFDMNTPQGEVTLENGSFEGCDSTIAVNINFVPFEIDFEVYNEGCNEDLGGIYINGSSVNSPLTYEINGISATSSLPELPKLIELAEGDYTLNVSNPDGCSQSYAVTIEPNPSSYGSTINSTVISKNSYQLALESNGTISELEWTPSIILSCIDCLNPIATIYQNEQIEVLVIYDDGCEERLAINLIYEEEATVTLPNIFTPNRDGYNDMFYLSHYDENALITEFYVFDRWGSKVFSAENVPANKPEFGWDGKFNEKEAAQGVYVYYIAVEQLNVSQPTIYAGDVTLIR